MTPELHPAAAELIRRMTGPQPSHRRFVGEPIDLTRIDALTLGDVWAAAHSVRLWGDHGRVEGLAAETARAVLDLSKDMEPVFRGSACRDHLDLLAQKAEEKPREGFPASFDWHRACFTLARCIDLSFDGLAVAARRCLAATDWRPMPQLAVALARLVDADFTTQVLAKLATTFAASPLLVDELRVVAALDLPAIIAVADVAHPAPMEETPPTPGATHYRLSDYPGYVAFAETGLRRAAERLRKIHQLELPYASDKAFTIDESAVIARLVRVGLDRDEAWMPDILDELFRKVSVAPTAAKSLPSQSVAIALGHAIEAFPTPEAVATLRDVLRDIRHAGVEKKLQRNRRGAERGLADRPEIALRLPADRPISKPQLTTLTRCLEAGFASRMVLAYDDWRVRLAERAQAKALTASLVWRILDAAGGSIAVLPIIAPGGLTLQDVTGATAAAASGHRMTLWHPSHATAAERNAWRDRLAALRIKQPFKQVFREHYVVAADEVSGAKTAMFSGHVVSITPFLGLARRERWRLDYDCLSRSFGQWTARLDLADEIYPGCVGATTTRNLSLWTSSGGKKPLPARLGDLPAATLSEILRAVDLLVSTSGFAVTAEDEERHRETRLQRLALGPLAASTHMRKEALERALRGRDDAAGWTFDARHLRLGGYAIHLATGRVTRDGEPVTIDLPKRSNLAAVPWLPYDEKLLEMIFYTAIELAQRHN